MLAASASSVVLTSHSKLDGCDEAHDDVRDEDAAVDRTGDRNATFVQPEGLGLEDPLAEHRGQQERPREGFGDGDGTECGSDVHGGHGTRVTRPQYEAGTM